MLRFLLKGILYRIADWSDFCLILYGRQSFLLDSRLRGNDEWKVWRRWNSRDATMAEKT
ncbi:MAG: hypothetical protein FWG81_11520 [Betaproteobacteria bacterium]|nr:hypothetical protein [Betaproteobacteria bacterium]